MTITPFRVSTLSKAKGGLFMKFEWDKNKAAANLSKHYVSFDEAKTVFNDPLYVDFYDIDHSDNIGILSLGSHSKVDY